MKKFFHTLLISIPMFLLAACSSGISQAEYDNLQNELNTLQSEYDSLSAENISLSIQVEELKSEKEELAKSSLEFVAETTNTQLENLDSQYNNEYVQLITDQIYGNNCNFVIADNFLYINAFYTQEYSYELYQKMLSDCEDFSALYRRTAVEISDTSENLLNFDFILIYCFDKNLNGVVSISYSQTDTIIQVNDVMLGYQYLLDIAHNANN